MRYSYGIIDRRRILLYNPQLFLNTDDVLVFPSKDFHIWHGNIKEYIDGIYQINTINIEKQRYINIDEHNLASGVLDNIAKEMKSLFDSEINTNFSYYYLSTLDEKFKKLSNIYSSDMRKCDIRVPVKPEITPWLKYQNILEIVEESWELFNSTKKKDLPNDYTKF